jgi:hypothetical protein
MNWTTNPPTRPGKYKMRDLEKEYIVYVEKVVENLTGSESKFCRRHLGAGNFFLVHYQNHSRFEGRSQQKSGKDFLHPSRSRGVAEWLTLHHLRREPQIA